MKNFKLKTKLAILGYAMLCAMFTSCVENVKVVELQSIIVDTTYIYKVERNDGGELFYDIVKTKGLFKQGETFKIVQ